MKAKIWIADQIGTRARPADKQCDVVRGEERAGAVLIERVPATDRRGRSLSMLRFNEQDFGTFDPPFAKVHTEPAIAIFRLKADR